MCLYLLSGLLAHSIVNYSSRLAWRTRTELFRSRELSTSWKVLMVSKKKNHNSINYCISRIHSVWHESVFWRKGKVRTLDLMLKNPEFMMTIAELGNNWEIDEISLLSKIEVFVCVMYGCTSRNSVNKLRCASILQFLPHLLGTHAKLKF